MMIKLQNIKDNSRSRRDAQRKAKQQAWANANPMLVGRKYKVKPIQLSVVKKAGYSPAPLKFIARNAFSLAREYKMQIVRASFLYQYEFKRKPLVDGPACLPEVALYRAGHRKSDNITAR
ncbi:hypothetical protein ACLPHD_06500 [Serratia odorifera]|uniref:transcriptional antitermination N peptide n=1 Tax=Serratia odorifera TaxID=618 RepID=UPI003D26D845